MADYTNSKGGIGSVFPDRAVAAQEIARIEPLITPELFKRRFLLGIPLHSFVVDPVTNERDEVTMDDLKDFINRAVAESEIQSGLTIFPTQFNEKHPFDRNFWNSYGFIKVDHRPMASLETMAFTPATGQDIFQINNNWVESANFHKGQINLIPMIPAVAAQFVSSSGNAGGSGFAYLNLMQGMSWIPAIVRVQYTAGFADGKIPYIVNELIGCNAAMEVLNVLQATNRHTSYSLNVDGQGQSVSTPGPQIYQPRIESLEKKRDKIVRLLKNIYGLSVITSYI
jgi:hypothetical protein